MRSKNAIFNIITSLFLQLIIIIYGFIVPKIIISEYGSSVNGLVSSITQFLGYISLLQAGFGPVVKSLLYKPIANKDKTEIANILKATEKFFRNIAKIFILYIILLAIFYPLLIDNQFGYFYTLSLIVIISISIFTEYYFGMTYSLYLQAEQKNYIISIFQAVTYLLSIICVIILVKFDVSIHLIKLVSGLIFVFRPIFLIIYVKKLYNIKFSSNNDNYVIKNKWDGLAQHIAAVIHGNTDITLLTIFCKLSEVSVYSVYYLVVNGIKKIVLTFSDSINSSWGDMIAKNEKKNLIEKFNAYEVVYNIIVTIIFSSALILIVPFVSVYTKNIVDVNYVRYTFGYLIVISEYICMIRLPYINLAYAAGHFKQTRIGAWVECISNIFISIIFVRKYGLVGVTIGTIIAMFIRTCEFVYHSNKYILNRSIWSSVKKIMLVIIETIIIILISKILPFYDNVNYLNWVLNSIIVVLISVMVTFSLNIIFYKNELKNMLKLVKSVFRRKNNGNRKEYKKTN